MKEISIALSLVPEERLIMHELLTFARLDVAPPSPPLPPPGARASDPTRRHKTRVERVLAAALRFLLEALSIYLNIEA